MNMNVRSVPGAEVANIDICVNLKGIGQSICYFILVSFRSCSKL